LFNVEKKKKKYIFLSKHYFRSRQWGVVEQYRLGRIMWRRFADYNQMSGVMRSTFDRYTRQNTEMMSRERRIIREDP
jgi:hypothetical protein